MIGNIYYGFKMADTNEVWALFHPRATYSDHTNLFKIIVPTPTHVQPHEYKKYVLNPETSLKENLGRTGIFLEKFQIKT